MMRLRSARWIAWFVSVVVLIPYAGGAAAAAQAASTYTQTIVVFPMDMGTGVTNSRVGAAFTSFLMDALSAQGRYRVIAYSDRLPAVQRLLAMQPEKTGQVSGPFSGDEAAVSRALVIAKAMSADLFVVGSVTAYSFDSAGGTVDVTVDVQVIDGKTGATVSDMRNVKGHAAKAAGTTSVSEENLMRQAVKDAGRKVVETVTGQPYSEETRPAPAVAVVTQKKSNKKSWIPMLLLSLGVGLLLGGGGGSDTPADDGLEPPPPPPLQ